MLPDPDLAESWMRGAYVWTCTALDGWEFWWFYGPVCILVEAYALHPDTWLVRKYPRMSKVIWGILGLGVAVPFTLGCAFLIALAVTPFQQRDSARAYASALEAQRDKALVLKQVREMFMDAYYEYSSEYIDKPVLVGARQSAWGAKMIAFMNTAIRPSAAMRMNDAVQHLLGLHNPKLTPEDRFHAARRYTDFVNALTESDIDASWVSQGQTWATWTASKTR